tara:strand:- start:16949 stop:17245 length:297 start_codon:yes stop_codon:yes gene_type:complete
MIKEFTLGSSKWSVTVVDSINKRETLGICCHPQTSIDIAMNYSGGVCSSESMEQTLYHEVVHAILLTMGEYELSDNEQFVQQFSVLMQQFEQTKKLNY